MFQENTEPPTLVGLKQVTWWNPLDNGSSFKLIYKQFNLLKLCHCSSPSLRKVLVLHGKNNSKSKYSVPNRLLRLLHGLPHELTVIPTRSTWCETILILATDLSRLSYVENLMKSFKRVEKKMIAVSRVTLPIQIVWWFEWEGFPVGSYVWPLDSQW